MRLLNIFGLALAYAAIVTTPVHAGEVIPPKIETTTPTGINLSDDSFTHKQTDIAIGSLALERFYIGGDLSGPLANRNHYSAPWFGTRMSHNYDIFVKRVFKPANPPFPQRYRPRIYVGQQSFGPFTESGAPNVPANGTVSASSPDASAGDLQAVGGAFVYTDREGAIYTFNSAVNLPSVPQSGGKILTQRVASIAYPNGRKLSFSYNASKQLKLVSDSQGYALVFDYDANSRITAVCAFNTSQTSVTATSTCAGAAIKASYGYSGTGSLTSFTDQAGRVTTYGRSATGTADQSQISCITPPGYSSCKVANTNGYGNVTQQTLADGTIWQYSGGANDCVRNDECAAVEPGQSGTDVTNPLGQLSSFRFTKSSPYKFTDPLGRVTEYAFFGGRDTEDIYEPYPYEEGGMLTAAIMPDGQKYTASYYEAGLSATVPYKSKMIAKAGSGLADLNDAREYLCATRACSKKPTKITDPKGNVTDFTYDTTHGGVLTETLPAAPNGVRPQKRYSYAQFFSSYKNTSGTQTQNPTPIWLPTAISECRTLTSCAGTSDETVTSFAYGAQGTVGQLLRASMTVRAGDSSVVATTSYTYDANGDKLTEDGPLSGAADTTRWRYDSLRRVIGEIGPDPDGAGALKHRAVRNTYDTPGRLTKVERGTVNSQSDADWAAFVALESVETDYDLMDRKTVERKKSGTATYALSQYSYDALGRLECTAVRMNPATYASLPVSACTLGTEGSDGPDRITRLTYNAASELIKTTVAYGTSMQADDETNSYTANGKLATVTDGENNRTTFEYDGHDRLAKTRYPVTALGALASSTTDYEQLSYDANGNVTQRRLRDGQLINTAYDNLNRATTKDLPAPESDVVYAYDLQGRMLSATQGAQTNALGYDALGRMVSETSGGYTTGLQYDAAGRLTRVTHSDGFYAGYVYNSTDLTSINENGTTTLVSYSMDDLGRRTSLTRGNGTMTNYAYDPVSRLSSFSQDLAGSTQDLTVGTFSYNPASQILGYSRSNDSYAWGVLRNRTGAKSVNKGRTLCEFG
jgi:YD repeat-containing protein